MTFPELEKACKKRKLIRMIKYVLFVFILTSVLTAVFYVYKNTKTANLVQKKLHQNKSDVNTREKNSTEKTEDFHKPYKNIQERKLKLIIDLNISRADTKSNIIGKKQNLNKKKSVTREYFQEQNKTHKILTTTLPSYKTCISLAENYYKKGEYKKALNWAKNANIQNKDNPESWIISAKALYKLGKKDESLKILKIYYNYHKNEEIKKLMGALDEKGN